MEKTQIKEQMREIENKMGLIEWDRKHSGSFSKNHIYDNLKKEYEELQNKLEGGEGTKITNRI